MLRYYLLMLIYVACYYNNNCIAGVFRDQVPSPLWFHLPYLWVLTNLYFMSKTPLKSLPYYLMLSCRCPLSDILIFNLNTSLKFLLLKHDFNFAYKQENINPSENNCKKRTSPTGDKQNTMNSNYK